MVTNEQNQKGIAYLWMLFLIFLFALGLGKTLEVYSTIQQREKEQELLYVGNLYREAIKQYYLSGRDNKVYPKSLDDLLKDPRHLVVRRYLRELYLDPITNRPFIVILAPEGGIWGVRSSSSVPVIKVSGFGDKYQSFEKAKTYQDWDFIYSGEEY
ncbi:hypothetical protein [Aquirhabdus sp.]|uniref:hypothetical protein n=1 Tax=Aquirhabdus sp. TaxID=2824160 RepID=UPI00396CA9C7